LVIRAVIDCADEVPAADAWSRLGIAASLITMGATSLFLARRRAVGATVRID